MQGTLAGAIRNRIFTPNPREVTFERRGFRSTGAAQQANLERIGRTFLSGFSCGMTGGGVAGIGSGLALVDKPFLGFAFEGCAMALAVRDALLPRQHWIRDFLAGPGAPHVYMAHIGIGWAMARLP